MYEQANKKPSKQNKKKLVDTVVLGDVSKQKNAVVLRLGKNLTLCLEEVEKYRSASCHCGRMVMNENYERKFFDHIFDVVFDATREYQRTEKLKKLSQSPFSRELERHAKRLQSIKNQLGEPSGCAIT